MPAAKPAADAATSEPAETSPTAAPAVISTAANPAPAAAVTGLSRLLSRAAESAMFGGDAVKAPALAALSARMDDLVVALPAALAVAEGELKAGLAALSSLLK